MKGKLLSYEEIKGLKDGTKIWFDGLFNKCLAFTYGEEIYDTKNESVLIYKSDLADGDRKVYEWLEEPESEQTITKTEKETNTYNKTYKGSEILSMIEDGRLKEDAIVITTTGSEVDVSLIMDGVYKCDFLLNNLFTIKQKPVDFMTAVNSGKFIRPISYNKQKDFQSYRYWIDFLVTYKSWSKDPLDLINGLWEIEY